MWTWQVGPARIGWICSGWGYEIARFWNPRFLVEHTGMPAYTREEVITMRQVAVSRRGMSVAEQSVWYLMILCTCGLAYPLYRMRRHAANRTEKFYVE